VMKHRVAATILVSAVMLMTAVGVMMPRTSHALALFAPHEVIRITGDDDLVVGQNGIVMGSGTSSDPFVISGWEIGQISGSSGIEVWNTKAHLKIVGLNISSCNIGILLYNVSDVSVKSTIFYKNILGLSIQYSKDCKVSDCVFQENYYGITIRYSDVSRSGNDYIGNTQNVIEKKQPWEQGWMGTLVCVAVLVPLSIAVAFMLFFRVKSRPKPPPEVP
jgi:parallel beta-helix repeat protein